MVVNRYRCNNSRFYQEWIVDNDGKYSIMFACHDLISAVVHQGATELHADATFKVVPSMPHCRQLFIIHLIFYQVKNTTVVLYVSVVGVKLMKVLSTFFCHVAMDGAVILVVNTKPIINIL
uniref:Uncharacterized protein n=1 Tax=Schizaphis graminum TaxID=13262 RepID=A0A2S2PJV0_SCHGA